MDSCVKLSDVERKSEKQIGTQQMNCTGNLEKAQPHQPPFLVLTVQDSSELRLVSWAICALSDPDLNHKVDQMVVIDYDGQKMKIRQSQVSSDYLLFFFLVWGIFQGLQWYHLIAIDSLIDFNGMSIHLSYATSSSSSRRADSTESLYYHWWSIPTSYRSRQILYTSSSARSELMNISFFSGRPTLVCPLVEVHWWTELMSSSLLL